MFPELQNSWQTYNHQISTITATTEISTMSSHTVLMVVFATTISTKQHADIVLLAKTWTSWIVAPSIAGYQKQAAKIQNPPWPVQRICRHWSFCSKEESNLVEVVVYCNVCFIREVTIVANHRPPRTPNFNTDCNLLISSAASMEFWRYHSMGMDR